MQEKSDIIHQANSLLSQANEFFAAGKYPLAQSKASQAEKLYSGLGKTFERMKCQSLIADLHRKQGNYLQCIALASKTIEHLKQMQGNQEELLARNLKTLANCDYEMGRYQSFIDRYLLLIEIYKQQYSPIHYKIAIANSSLGIGHNCLGNRQLAHKYHKRAIELCERQESNHLSKIGICYSNYANVFLAERDYQKAIILYYKAIAVIAQANGEDHIDSSTALVNLGICYRLQGDLQKSIKYQLRALKLRKQYLGDQHNKVGDSFINLGNSYCDLGEYEKAISHMLQGIDIYTKVYGQMHLNLAQAHENLATVYDDIGKFPQARKHLYQALEIYEHCCGKHHLRCCRCLINLGSHFYATEEWDRSISYLEQALKLQIQKQDVESSSASQAIQLPAPSSGYDALTLLICLQSLARAYERNFDQDGNPLQLAKALFYLQVAKEWIIFFRKSYQNEESQLSLLRSVKDVLYQGIELCKRAMTVAQEKHQQWQESTSRILEANEKNFPKENFHYAFTESDIGLVLFQFFQQAKSSVLLTRMKQVEAKDLSNLPQALVEKEEHLRSRLRSTNRSILKLMHSTSHSQSQSANSDRDSDHRENLKLKKKLHDLRALHWQLQREIDQLMQEMEQEHPSYYELKYHFDAIDLKAIQKRLQPNQAILEYLQTESAINILLITDQQLRLTNLSLSTNQEKLISDFLIGISRSQKSRYAEAAYQLYKLLIQPIRHLIQSKDELIIIPDASLYGLPFEALLSSVTKDSSYIDLPYLIREFIISYQFSASLWYRTMQKASEQVAKSNSFIGYAPVYSSAKADKTLEQRFTAVNTRSTSLHGQACTELKHSEEEVKAVVHLFEKRGHKVASRLHEAASLSSFRAEIEEYKFILVAAHASYKEQQHDYSGISFSPEKQYASATAKARVNNSVRTMTPASLDTTLCIADTYHLRLNADLIVLSCCQSGLGKKHEGEGILGLNRGFVFAGASNVIYTLFKVYDDYSSKLTQHLFSNILEGKSYKAALRLSKLQLIRQESSSPMHWAGFVILGR